MAINAFLASLPAILALVGFVAYQLLRRSQAGDAITKRIVDKLRLEEPETAIRYQRLHPSQLHEQLKADRWLREKVSQRDFALLHQTLKQRFVESLAVYAATIILFVVGAGLFVRTVLRPVPTSLSDFHLESRSEEAAGLAVDLDPLELSWKHRGTPLDVECFLENAQTLRRSEIVRTSSAEGKALFPIGSYDPVLANRERGSFNRVRAICGTGVETFTSSEFRVHVGIKILVFFDPDKSEVCVAGLIDNSSIPWYYFEAKVIVRRRTRELDFVSFGDEIRNPKTCFTVEDPDSLDWASLDVAYFEPDDSRLIRTEPLVDHVSPATEID